jgi:hypothetical protein
LFFGEHSSLSASSHQAARPASVNKQQREQRIRISYEALFVHTKSQQIGRGSGSAAVAANAYRPVFE